MISYKPSNALLVILVSLVRCVTAFLIYVNVMMGWWVTAILDVVDGQVLMHMGSLTPAQYHRVDKILDTFVQLVMLVFAYRSPYFVFLLALYIHRLAGQFVFWKTANEKYLIMFPNLFETFWLWLIAVPSLNMPILLVPINYALILAGLLCFKAFQELLVHDFGSKTIFPWVSSLVYENRYSLSKRSI